MACFIVDNKILKLPTLKIKLRTKYSVIPSIDNALKFIYKT